MQHDECSIRHERNITLLRNNTELRVTCQHVSTYVCVKINFTNFEKLSGPMEASATVKQPRFFIGESLKTRTERSSCITCYKSTKTQVLFNRAITTVADPALDSDGWVPRSLLIHDVETPRRASVIIMCRRRSKSPLSCCPS